MWHLVRDACEYLGCCPLAGDEAGYSPELARLIRQQWCRCDYRTCARYQVAQAVGLEAVPVDFFPAEMRRVSSIIEGAAS